MALIVLKQLYQNIARTGWDVPVHLHGSPVISCFCYINFRPNMVILDTSTNA
jgi:hypothetical protein